MKRNQSLRGFAWKIITGLILISQAATGGNFPNPGLIQSPGQCPAGWSGPGYCPLPDWIFCAHGTTPDSWDSCSALMTMPVNVFGLWGADRMVGLFSCMPAGSGHSPEWIGLKLSKPIPAGHRAEIRIIARPSRAHKWAGGVYAVAIDTARIDIQNLGTWQTYTAVIFPPVLCDTVYIGGETGWRVPVGGPNDSAYLGICWIGVFVW